MRYTLRDGVWVCEFLESDLRTRIGRTRRFSGSYKVRELIERTETKFGLEGEQAIDHGIASGLGGLYLDLSEEQYRKLKE